MLPAVAGVPEVDVAENKPSPVPPPRNKTFKHYTDLHLKQQAIYVGHIIANFGLPAIIHGTLNIQYISV